MKIEGRLRKSGNWWAIEIPLLCIYTQAKAKGDAYRMAKAAIEELVDQAGFSVLVEPLERDAFTVKASDDKILMAFALRQQRSSRGLTQEDVARALSYSSKNAYAQYEQGKATPSLDKFTQFLQAMDKHLEPILKIG